MALQKLQSYLNYDASTVGYYKSLAQGIGAALATLGWVLAGDAGQVNWANVISPPPAGDYSHVTSWGGAWSAGLGFLANQVVTDSGLTYECIAQNYNTLSLVVQNTAVTESISAVVSSGGTGIYTMPTDALGASDGYAGYLFTVTGCTPSQNNGIFICTGSTTTSLTLANPSAYSASGLTGSAESYATNCGFYGSYVSASPVNNSYVGLSVTTTGFVNSANNTTFAVTASTTNWVFGAVAGTFESHSGTITIATAPASDPTHFQPYNYEIYVSNGPLSATAPIYLKLIYGVNSNSSYGTIVYYQIGTSQGNGIIGGNVFNAGATRVLCGGNINATGATTYECDFCGNADKFAMIVLRPLVSCCGVLAIDRGKDNSGNDIGTYAVVLASTSSIGGGYQVIFPSGGGAAVSPATVSAYWPCIYDTQSSAALGGTAPIFLAFPMIGFMANPCIGGIAMHTGDSSEGELVNVTMYGATHTFLMTQNAAGGGAVLASNAAVGIQWET